MGILASDNTSSGGASAASPKLKGVAESEQIMGGPLCGLLRPPAWTFADGLSCTPESLAICLLIRQKGGPVLVVGFRRRENRTNCWADACAWPDGCGRDDRAPQKVANDWGCTSFLAASHLLQLFRISRPLHRDFGCGVCNFTQIVGHELDGNGAVVLVQPMELGGAWDWNNPRFLRQQPG
jgi:hypothetical protein